MQNPRLIMAKVEDGQSQSRISLPILCTFDEHYSGTAAIKAKEIAMNILNSKSAFTHVSFEPVARPDLESSIKRVLKLTPGAFIHQRIYNPHQAEFRGYAEREIDGYLIKYALRTSGFCSYAIVDVPESQKPVVTNNNQTVRTAS